MPQQISECRDTRKAISQLCRDGWTMWPGKRDYPNFSKSGIRPVITIDAGKRRVSKPIHNCIKEVAGW